MSTSQSKTTSQRGSRKLSPYARLTSSVEFFGGGERWMQRVRLAGRQLALLFALLDRGLNPRSQIALYGRVSLGAAPKGGRIVERYVIGERAPRVRMNDI